MTSIDIPRGEASVKVAIIDNGGRISGPLSFFMEPPLLEHVSGSGIGAPAYVFMVEHEKTGRRVLFDLGIRADIEEYAPAVLTYHQAFKLVGGQEISDFLKDRDVNLSSIEAIVWSHHHLDHIGNPAGFPSTTDLIVGSGFKETILPGYPENEKAQIRQSDYEGRKLRQVNFDEDSKGLTIGGFRALDYFEDGSFYLLETPGHTIDHLAGLARTSVSPSTFILMGGDIGHHASQWRPTELVPLPEELEPSPFGTMSRFNLRTNVCPGELFVEHVHPQQSNRSPFLKIKAGHPYDADMARSSLKTMEPFDADENILVITAHDFTLLPVLEYWPKTANGWKEANWKELGRWKFLEGFVKHVEDRAK